MITPKIAAFIILLPCLINADPSKTPNWQELQTTSPYFNKRALVNYDAIRQDMIKNHGFQQVTFKSEDGIELAGLLRINPQADTTIISCSGFFPGVKEGMSTLKDVAPNNCNLFFIDARGHGQSKGNFWGYRGNYGRQEYKDIIGAIHYAHGITHGKKIIVHGVCMGAFHASHALIKLSDATDAQTKQPLIEKYNVKGFVSDSGFHSLCGIRDLLHGHVVNNLLPEKFKSFYNKGKAKEQHLQKKDVLQKTPYKVAAALCKGIIVSLRSLLIDSDLEWYEPDTRLTDKVHRISCPIWYVHAQEDTYSYQKDSAALAENTPVKRTWWVQGEKEHAENHRLHPAEYHEQLSSFIQYCNSDTWKEEMANSEMHKKPVKSPDINVRLTMSGIEIRGQISKKK
ncbi:MAG TPA: hypothetical protein VFF04_03470 [Candidatus Babeliales bacterium]|nr:hypothetical protein [Candidatus Babeliales bacterium]